MQRQDLHMTGIYLTAEADLVTAGSLDGQLKFGQVPLVHVVVPD